MENATKALIIAGAILIAIMLISIGLIIINSTKGIVDQGTQTGKIMEMQVFNSKFEAYEGKRTGAEVKQLINLVRASNIADPEHQVLILTFESSILNSKKYNIMIQYANLEKQSNRPYYGHYVNNGGKCLAGPNSSDANFLNMENGYIEWISIN